MQRTGYLLLTASLILMSSGMAVGKEWRGIVPLHSTRSDVERLFGLSPYGGGLSYEFEGETVYFQYQYPDYECGKTWGRWNVPLNTVLEITVYPKRRTLLADLNLDTSKFKRDDRTCLLDSFGFANEEEGVTYSFGGGVLAGIRYYPSAGDEYLACPKVGVGY